MFYIINTTRFVIGFIFLFSFVTKLHDVTAFERTISNFQLLPRNLHRPAVCAFMLGEIVIGISAFVGQSWLLLSYILALLLLLLFIYALNSVLKRNIQATCNCFGTSEQKISPYDIWRNLGFILVALSGLVSFLLDKGQSSLGNYELLLSAIVALILSLLLLNLRELLELVM